MVVTGCQEDFESLDFFGKGIDDFGLRELFQFFKFFLWMFFLDFINTGKGTLFVYFAAY